MTPVDKMEQRIVKNNTDKEGNVKEKVAGEVTDNTANILTD